MPYKDIEKRRANNRRLQRFYRSTPEGAASARLSRARYVAKHPERIKAKNAVTNAVMRGRMERKPCEVCGDPKSEAHHDDYTKPLEVRWLCKIHHEAEHHGERH